MNKTFALIGAGGFVAPRHMKAIKDSGNRLVAAYDISDSVGVLDQFGYNIDFYTNQNQFEKRLHGVDFLSVATPNYFHRVHCKLGLSTGCDVICEKPLVLYPHDLEYLQDLEQSTGNRVYTVLQLRLHPALVALKQEIENSQKQYSVSLTYVTPRGNWYFTSWKGQDSLSGGLVFNIGIHLLDMLLWLFGGVQKCTVFQRDPDCAAGLLQLERAEVDWFLSVNAEHSPENRPSRVLSMDGKDLDFSTGFTDLHTRVYQEVLAGRGFGISDVEPSIKLASEICSANISMKRKILLNGCRV